MKRFQPILKITTIYVVFASIWILFSDQILAWLIPDPDTYIRAQTVKGWFFVLVTAIILYRTILNEFKRHWEYERELEIIAAFSKHLRGILDPQQLTQKILPSIRNLFNADMVFFGQPESMNKAVKFSFLKPNYEWITQYIPATALFLRHIFEQSQTVSSLDDHPDFDKPDFLSDQDSDFAITPLIARETVIGVIGFTKIGKIKPSDVHILQAVAEISSQAFYAADLLLDNATQIQRLSTFRKIDDTILSDYNTQDLIDLFLKEFINNLNVDAATVTVINDESQSLEFYLHAGLDRPENDLYLEEAAAYVSVSDSILVIQNTKTGINSQRTYPLHHPINDPSLTGYAVAPLRNMGQLIGIVEVFSKKEINWNRENLQFFEALAKQTAIAIDKVSMVINLKKSNIELLHSYEQTLEGWSRAMDIRDHETENHSQRVTSMTMKMGEKLMLQEEQLVQMRRGALLHDIGKLGVPDNILNKKGSLTEEEWQIMRQHPITARELIKPIAFLSPAMSIPYFHHEKWDGSGYPQGLQGEDIPIEARIFSIVDVWDALTTDRPYRAALAPVEAATHIIGQSNLHFDPQIVAVFLELLQDEGFLTRNDLFQIHSKEN